MLSLDQSLVPGPWSKHDSLGGMEVPICLLSTVLIYMEQVLRGYNPFSFKCLLDARLPDHKLHNRWSDPSQCLFAPQCYFGDCHHRVNLYGGKLLYLLQDLYQILKEDALDV